MKKLMSLSFELKGLCRSRPKTLRLILAGLLLSLAGPAFADPLHPWRGTNSPERSQLQDRFAPPGGFARYAARPGSFTHWLRRLPLMPEGQRVMLFNGQEKPNQSAHAAVIDIDVGKRDLQQCADAVMRLRAEYLYAQNRFKDIRFNFTGGTPVPFSRWSMGDRPHVSGRKTHWRRGGRTGRDRQNFKRYMTMIFSYAGTYSLARELKSIDARELRAGDVFIKGGFPGHAVIVADVAIKPESGEKRFLLIQSFMPAQSMHVLKNPNSPDGSAWYALLNGEQLVTPEWSFAWSALKRFPD